MNERVYIRMKKKVGLSRHDTIYLKDLAYIEAGDPIRNMLLSIPIQKIKPTHGEYLVIEAFILLAILRKVTPKIDIEFIGPEETIVKIEGNKTKRSIPFILMVWSILFIGTAMSIMNFHFDVSMPAVHEKLHYMFTGVKTKHPLTIQIPYAIGLGVGMILFLNHWFKKKINDEPSPLEIELYNYEKDIESYIKHYENDLNDDQDYF